MIISLTVGKVDAGNAVLLTDDKRLIEFPSVLLPPDLSSGSIVDVVVTRNLNKEAATQKSFLALQSSIFETFGQVSPSAPVLRCRNATQTSVVLEWDPIQLATADIRSLCLYRNSNKTGTIPRPMEITSTKISGLAVDTEYTWHLVLQTSAGQYNSEKLAVRTHKMTDLSGITVTPGVLPAPLRESLTGAVERIGGKIVENVRIDTTHFVCTEGRGREWEKAVEMNIPVVRPEWVEGCEREGRIVGVRGYYLNADPKTRQVGPGVGMQQQQQMPRRQRTESQMTVKKSPPMQQEERRQESAQSTPTQSSRPVPLHRTNGSDAGPPPPAKDTPRQDDSTSGDEEVVNGDDSGGTPRQSEYSNTRASEPPVKRDPTPQPTVEDEDEGPKTPGDAGSFSSVQL